MERTTRTGPLLVAIVDDYEVVVRGLAHMFDQYDEICVAELDVNEPVTTDVHVALYDTFAQAEADRADLDALVANPHVGAVVVYTWAFAPELVDHALAKGASGYLSKTLQASELVEALIRIAGGEVVVSDVPTRARATATQNWPGREETLTERESEVIALITQGYSNREVAELMYLSPNSIKSYIRSSYRKMGVTSRTQAVLWGIAHGFKTDNRSLDRWSTG
jgi:two-component system, NarL family, response regulator LiaR